MSKLLFGKINLSKIDKTKLFTGDKGIYLDVTIWLNDTPDKFGNDMSIEQATKQGEDKIYIGNAKYYVPKEPTPITEEEIDDLPF
jgi:hypothetical protein